MRSVSRTSLGAGAESSASLTLPPLYSYAILNAIFPFASKGDNYSCWVGRLFFYFGEGLPFREAVVVPFSLHTSLLTHAGRSLGVLDAVALRGGCRGCQWALVGEGPWLRWLAVVLFLRPPLAYYCERVTLAHFRLFV